MKTVMSHQTIIIGWNHGVVEFCRTFDDINDRENMLKAYEQVNKDCEMYIMSTKLNKLINKPFEDEEN